MKMNWKLITLAAGLILTTSLTACSQPDTSTNQVSPSPAASASPDAMKNGDAMSPSPSGDAMKNGDAMKKDGDAMKNGDAMKKDGDAMKNGDAMKKDGDAMKQK